MTSPSKNKSAKIRELIQRSPEMTAQQIAKAVGCRPQQVYTVKYLMKRKDRKSGIATKSTRKVIRITKSEADLAKRLNVPVTEYAKNLAGYDANFDIIADLRHQIVGFRAVISYLENQLGLKNSQ